MLHVFLTWDESYPDGFIGYFLWMSIFLLFNLFLESSGSLLLEATVVANIVQIFSPWLYRFDLRKYRLLIFILVNIIEKPPYVFMLALVLTVKYLRVSDEWAKRTIITGVKPQICVSYLWIFIFSILLHRYCNYLMLCITGVEIFDLSKYGINTVFPLVVLLQKS